MKDVIQVNHLLKSYKNVLAVNDISFFVKEEDFEILDFPCNQFFRQAPGSSEEIHEVCVLRFMIAFDQFEKIDVNGKNEHPLCS
ncbi:MAG: hypothetical protein K6E21_03970 [Bacilli bacterium]|nr:hypothetical protein [Bacilli bacterium]